MVTRREGILGSLGLGLATYQPRAVPNSDPIKSGLEYAAFETRAALSVANNVEGPLAYLLEAGREGLFRWYGSDFSKEVSSDRQQGVYVAPAYDLTGATGAWVRQHDGFVAASWFGVVADGTTDNQCALQAAIDFCLLGGNEGCLVLPAGEMVLEGDVTIGPHGTIRSEHSRRFTMVGKGAGSNGSWLHFASGSLVVAARQHVLDSFRVTSDSSNGIEIKHLDFPMPSYPARSVMYNIEASNCRGSGITIEDCWIYSMFNCFARFNRNWGIEGKVGPKTGLSCNSLNIFGGEFQANGSIAGTSSNGGGNLKGVGGGIFTGRCVQLMIHGAAIEANVGDGLALGEQMRGLLLDGVYFEKNGSHPDNCDILNAPPSSATLGPNSICIRNCNFTPQNSNGTTQIRAIDLVDCQDLVIENIQFYAINGSTVYSAEPIRLRETLAGRCTGEVRGFYLGSTSYTQDVLRNECRRFGRPIRHVFAMNHVLPVGTLEATSSEYITVPLSSMAAEGVQVRYLAVPADTSGGKTNGAGTGIARLVATFRRGPTNTAFAQKSDLVRFDDEFTGVKIVNESSNRRVPGTFFTLTIARDGVSLEDTLSVSCSILSVEVVTYEGVVSALVSS